MHHLTADAVFAIVNRVSREISMHPMVHWWVVIPLAITLAIGLYSRLPKARNFLVYATAWLLVGFSDWLTPNLMVLMIWDWVAMYLIIVTTAGAIIAVRVARAESRKPPPDRPIGRKR